MKRASVKEILHRAIRNQPRSLLAKDDASHSPTGMRRALAACRGSGRPFRGMRGMPTALHRVASRRVT